MAVKKTQVKKYIVETMRDIDQSPVYVCVKGVDGKTISTKVPLGVAVELDANVIKSLKTRTEMVRVATKQGNETLVQKPTYSITEA